MTPFMDGPILLWTTGIKFLKDFQWGLHLHGKVFILILNFRWWATTTTYKSRITKPNRSPNTFQNCHQFTRIINIASFERLAIWRQTYSWKFCECLSEIKPITFKSCGQNFSMESKGSKKTYCWWRRRRRWRAVKF